MRECPVCKARYADDLSFCLEDGTPLTGSAASAELTELREYPTAAFGGQNTVPMAETPTLIRSAVPTVASSRPPSSNKFTILIATALLLAGTAVLLAAGFAGLWFYSGARDDKALAEPYNTNLNNDLNSYPSANLNISNSTNSQAEPTPTPSFTPIAKPSPSPTKEKKPTPEPSPETTREATPLPFPTRDVSPPRTISGGVLNGKAVSLPTPPYPPAARAVRASGAVTVQVLVDERGRVVLARAVSGHPLLRASAAQAARSARFSPTVFSGQPVRVRGIITYNFSP